MKKLNFIFFVLIFLYLPALWCQNWKSISKIGTYETAPYRQFIIDPYRNSIWCIQDLKVSVIENSGAIHKFTSTELGELWSNDELKFVFTPSNIFYNINVFGFHSFTNYSSVPIDSSLCDYLNMTNNNDTVFITMANQTGFRKFVDNTSEVFNKNYTEINAKGQFIYGNNGTSVIYKYEPTTNTSTILNSDPQYLGGIYNELKFSRHTDALYVAGKKGISFAFNYDFLDTITPNNTVNMPSPNVLEIEFDHEDKLWAVFGDASDVPFSLAKLEGSTWVNRYDATNSPIDFNNYLGMEIDTLGNVWVVDNQNLHTLLSENSPAWLSTVELKPTTTFSLHPNPTKDFIQLSTKNPTGEYQLLDAQGRIVKTEKIHTTNQLIDLTKLQSGIYFVAIDGNVKRFVKE